MLHKACEKCKNDTNKPLSVYSALYIDILHVIADSKIWKTFASKDGSIEFVLSSSASLDRRNYIATNNW